MRLINSMHDCRKKPDEMCEKKKQKMLNQVINLSCFDV